MKFYRTEIAVTFFPGTTLGLTEEQAQGRLQVKQIKALKEKGKFEILTQAQFKAGEVIGIEGDISEIIAPAPIRRLTLVEKEKKSK